MKKYIFVFTLLILLTACSRILEEPDFYEIEPVSTEIESPPPQELSTTPEPKSEPEPCRRVPVTISRGPEYNFSDDVDAIVTFVEAVHPNFIVEGRMCMDEYVLFREAYITAVQNPMNPTEFMLATKRFLSVFNDGHLSRTFMTGEWHFIDDEWEWESRLFQDGYFIDHLFLSRNGKLFLADDDFVITDDQVLAIGGVPYYEIFAVVDYYFGAYNYAGMQRARGRYARYQLMLHLAGADIYMYDDQLVVDITVLRNGEEYKMEVGFIPDHPSAYRLPCYEPEYRVRWEMMGDDIFYVSLNGGITNASLVVEASFAIERALADGVKYFIFDLRNFRGGHVDISPTLFAALGVTPPGAGFIIRLSDQVKEWAEQRDGIPYFHYLRHLTWADMVGREYLYIPRSPEQSDNPYGIFIIALTSERSFSAAPMFAAEIADSGFGMVIGEPGASPPTGVGAGQTLWTELSMLEIRPHYQFFLRPDAEADQQTLWPCIHVYEWYALQVALEYIESLIAP